MYIEDEQEWEVSGILQHKKPGARRNYLVAYSEYNESKAYWLLESELCNALDILNNYKVFHSLN